MGDSRHHSDRSHAEREAARARLAERRGTASVKPPHIEVLHGGRSEHKDAGSCRESTCDFESHTAPRAGEGAKRMLGSVGGVAASSVQKAMQWVSRHQRLTVLAIAAILLVVCIGAVASACAARQHKESVASEQAAYEKQTQLIEGEINLPPSLDPQAESTLKEKAQTNSDVDWIIRHTSALDGDGDKVLKKLLTLTAKEETAISFVRNFPERYPQEAGEPYDKKVKKGVVPELYQWDERWGYTVYSSTAFGLTGCCPTCFSMVYMGLTGQTDKTPYDMGVLADEMGYMDTYKGTVDTFLTEAAPKVGLSVQKMTVTSSALESALSQGRVVICNVSSGDFSNGNHFIVVTECDKNGKLTVRDPFSAVNTAQKWDIDSVISQTQALWAYSLV